MSTEEPIYWYRYEDVQYAASLNEYDEPVGQGALRVKLRRYRVLKRTPKGVWLEYGYGNHGRFVLTEARKRFACPTEEQAMESFIARKERQAKIYSAKLKRAELALKAAQRGIVGRDLHAPWMFHD